MENAGGETIKNFGGVEGIMKSLGTSAEQVSLFLLYFWNVLDI